MISQKHFVLIFITYALIVFGTIAGYPVERSGVTNINDQFEVKNETRYPNGTVVGEFSYMDDNGNPINVKYFADEFNYGVELKSAKILGQDKGLFWKANAFESISNSDGFQQTTDIINKNLDEKRKKMDLKNEKKSADYETFYRNDIRGLTQCDKDKVRVYLDREKKIIKRALENYEATKSCGRF